MLNSTATSPYLSIFRQPAFSSIKLADVHVKNNKGELVKADFTRLDRWEDREAIKSIVKKWDKKDEDEMTKWTATTSLMDELYGIELSDKNASLDKKLVTFANMDNNNFINGLVVNPQYRYKSQKRREIAGCGKVMMAMLAKHAQMRDIETFPLTLRPLNDTDIKTFYKKIGMEEQRLDKKFFYFKTDKMVSFIKKMDKEYDLGELNELA